MATFWQAVVNARLTDRGIERITGLSPHRVMPRSVLVHADRPLLFYTDETPDEHVDLSDFPNLTPRFPAVFLERRLTWLTIGASKGPVPSWKDEAWRGGRWVSGLLVEAVDLERGGYVGRPRARTLRQSMSDVVGKEAFGDAIKWCLVIYLYSANPKNSVIEGPQVVWLIPVREDGTVQPNKLGEGPSLLRFPLGGAMDELKTRPARLAYADAARVYLFPALFAYTTFNSPFTRLVKVEEHRPGPRGNTYNADTEELQELLTTVGGAKEHGIVRAMLTCRDRFFPT